MLRAKEIVARAILGTRAIGSSALHQTVMISSTEMEVVRGQTVRDGEKLRDDPSGIYTLPRGGGDLGLTDPHNQS